MKGSQKTISLDASLGRPRLKEGHDLHCPAQSADHLSILPPSAGQLWNMYPNSLTSVWIWDCPISEMIHLLGGTPDRVPRVQPSEGLPPSLGDRKEFRRETRKIEIMDA